MKSCVLLFIGSNTEDQALQRLEEISPGQLGEWEQAQVIFLGLYFLICKEKGAGLGDC